jgi:hypothetical protein
MLAGPTYRKMTARFSSSNDAAIRKQGPMGGINHDKDNNDMKSLVSVLSSIERFHIVVNVGNIKYRHEMEESRNMTNGILI